MHKRGRGARDLKQRQQGLAHVVEVPLADGDPRLQAPELNARAPEAAVVGPGASLGHAVVHAALEELHPQDRVHQEQQEGQHQRRRGVRDREDQGLDHNAQALHASECGG